MDSVNTIALKLRFRSPPQSLNSAYYLKGNGKVRTKESRAWGDKLLVRLQSYTTEINSFLSIYDPSLHGIKIDLTHYIPATHYYNLERLISSRSADLSNVEKLLIDVLFDARFNGRVVGGKTIQNLNINDKCIVEMRSRKLPNTKYIIDVKIELVELPFWNWDEPKSILDEAV